MQPKRKQILFFAKHCMSYHETIFCLLVCFTSDNHHHFCGLYKFKKHVIGCANHDICSSSPLLRATIEDYLLHPSSILWQQKFVSSQESNLRPFNLESLPLAPYHDTEAQPKIVLKTKKFAQMKTHVIEGSKRINKRQTGKTLTFIVNILCSLFFHLLHFSYFVLCFNVQPSDFKLNSKSDMSLGI